MSQKAAPKSTAISTETIVRAARELVGSPLPEVDRPAVAELVANLLDEMSALRAFDVGEAEPIGVYRADVAG
jgi:hypothetical protein